MTSLLLATSTLDDDQTLVRKALGFYRNHQLKEAVKTLQRVADAHPENLQALRYLGQIEFERENWGQAVRWLGKVVERDSSDMMSLFYLATSYRERGRYKAFLLQDKDWRKAEQCYRKVMELAPSMGDVFFEYALLERYRGKYFSALRYADLQRHQTPGSIKVLVGMHHFYDLLLFHGNAREVQDSLTSRQTPVARYYYGELLRRKGRLQKADSVFLQLLQDRSAQSLRTPLFLSLVRLKIQQHLPEEAERYYHLAVDSMRTFLDAALMFEDIKYTMSDNELRACTRSITLPEQRQFYKAFWLRRDPQLAAEGNIRLVEYYRRMLYAEKHYRYDGLRSWFNNPDKQNYLQFPRVFDLNDKFNDKGLVYLRHGDPDDISITLGEHITKLESWLYRSHGLYDKLIFHFTVAANAVGNNWRLTAYVPFTAVENMVDWDTSLLKMYRATSIDYASLAADFAELNKKSVEIGLNSDRYLWPKDVKTFSFPLSMAAFRSGRDRTRYEIYYSLKSDELNDNGIPPEKIRVSFAAYTKKWQKATFYDTTVSRDALFPDQKYLWIDQINFEGIPGDYITNLLVTIPGRKIKSSSTFRITLPSYSEDKLQISSLELAKSINPSSGRGRFVKNHLSVIPSPDRAFQKRDYLNVYFEIYNLPVTHGERLPFNVTYRLTLIKEKALNIRSKILGIFRKRNTVTSNQVSRYAQDSTSVEYLSMDLREKVAGDYLLEVIVHVPKNGEKISSKVRFKLE